LDARKLPGSGDSRPAHVRNFLDCMKSRAQPALNLELAQHVSTVAHLGNIAYRTGRKVEWESASERVKGEREADMLVGATYRRPWKLPYARRG
jgi:hypothetical protein